MTRGTETSRTKLKRKDEGDAAGSVESNQESDVISLNHVLADG